MEHLPPVLGDRSPFRREERDESSAETRQRDLEELAQLIEQLEQWRHQQIEARATPPFEWVFVQDPNGSHVRIRFQSGNAIQLRTAAGDRKVAFEAAEKALDIRLISSGPWKKDLRTLEWVVDILPPMGLHH